MKTRCLGCMEEYDDSYGLCPYCGYELDTEVDSPIHMQPGVLLHGRFLMGRVLGFGGFGVTYIAWDFTLQQKVAVKEYLPSEFATRVVGQTQVSVFGGKKEEQFGDGMSQFVQEAKRLAKFQNEEGIVRIYDSFAENNTAYIVMEYLEGETLTAYLERNGKIPVEEAVAMLTPVLESLEVVHREGIVHRDIAPDNIFLTKDGRVKLIDFGAARYATTSHSRSLTVIIKPGYSPEEQYRSRGDQGPHTDVYAIAAVLYKMVTGMVLPESMERRAYLEKDGKDPIIPVSKNCTISKNQENAIMNALNVRVEDRTPTAARFLEELTSEGSVKRVFGKIKLLENPKKWPLWAKISIPAAGAVIIGLFVMLFTGVIGPGGNVMQDLLLEEGQARVPGVINYSVDVAQNRLDEQGLGCQIIGAEYSDQMPAQLVLYQGVTAGQIVEEDSVVDVYISIDQGGPATEPGIMPYVVYKPEAEAVALLESMGLKVTVQSVFDDLIAEGLVVSQNRAPGTEMGEGGTVTLGISGGEDTSRPEATEDIVVLSKEGYDLYVGDKVSLQAEGGTGKYSYASSDEKVVKVDKKGEMTAVGKGTAKITVGSGEAKEAVCTVTVKDYEMSLNPKSLTVFVDGSATITVSGLPNNDGLSWSSENKNIASVNKNGKVTGKSVGSTTVTATWKHGDKTYKASAKVTVKGQGLTLSTYKITSFYVGETRTIKATTSSGQKVQWKSSDTSVAKVDSKGVVTAVGAGKATITATAGSHSESCSVTVIQPGISMTKSSATLYVGESVALSASTTPSGASVSWSSSDTGVAKVSGGKVTAVKNGSATIQASMTYGGKTYKATCKITVKNPGIKLSASSMSLTPGGSGSLKATTDPSGISVKWSSSDTGVATVSGGKVTAVKNGTATITAQMEYKGKSYKATCKVTVEKPSISISSSASTIGYTERDKDSCTLTAKVNPDGGTVKWSIDNTSVATIKGDGKKATVTAVSSGTAKVTATYSVSGMTVTDTCTIKVQKAASTLKISNFSYPSSGTCDSFRIQGTVSSNYALTKMECYGTCTSNALGAGLSDTADPLTLSSGCYSYDLSDATSYFINQYKKLYQLYEAAADLLGADDSVTMNITATIYDASGKSISFECTYVIHGD